MDNKEEIASGIVGSMGLFGGRNPMAGGQAIPIPANDMEIRGPIALMVNKLAAIDSTLKARLNQVKAMSSRNVLQAREDAVEAPRPAPAGANDNDLQADAEQETKKSDAARIAAIAGIAGLVALQFEPVQEAVKSIFSFAKDTISFLSSGFSIISDGLEFFLGGSTTGAVTPAAPSTSTTPTSTPTAPEIDTPDASPGVAEQSSPNFMSSVSGGALFGGAVGFMVGKTGVGAAVGAAVGAYSYFSGGGTQQQSSLSSDASAVSGTPSDATGGAITPVTPGAAGAADAAETQVGKKGSQVGGYLSKGGVPLNPAQDQWCSAFVNSSLARGGIKGATNVANSFQRWGVQIDPLKVQRGDVVLQTRGKGPDQVGGHVGIATGRIVNGKVEMIAGNSGKGSGPASRTVLKYTVPINSNLQVRRNDPDAPGITAEPVTTAGGTGDGLMGSIGDIATGVGRAAARIIAAASGDYTSRGLTESLNQGGDMASAITAAEIAKNNALADSNKKPSSSPTILPNINAENGPAPVQNVPQWSDITSTDHYLIRFGIDSPRPMRVLRPMAA